MSPSAPRRRPPSADDGGRGRHPRVGPAFASALRQGGVVRVPAGPQTIYSLYYDDVAEADFDAYLASLEAAGLSVVPENVNDGASAYGELMDGENKVLGYVIAVADQRPRRLHHHGAVCSVAAGERPSLGYQQRVRLPLEEDADMRAHKVTENIWWVGGIDWNLRDFHGFETPQGTTYNCYLVKGETGIALIDTTKAPFMPEVLARIESVTPLSSITHIVVNHVEPDHNGGLPEVMAAMPAGTVVASPVGAKSVAEYHNGLEIDTREGRRGDRPRRAHDHVHARVDGALARLDVHVLPRGARAHAERRVRPARGERGALRRRARARRGAHGARHLLREHPAPARDGGGQGARQGAREGLGARRGGAVARRDVAPAEDFGRVVEAYRRWGAGARRDKAVVAYSTMWGSTATIAEASPRGLPPAASRWRCTTSR